MPPILGLAQRRPPAEEGQPPSPPAQIFLGVVPNVQTKTVKPLIVAPGGAWRGVAHGRVRQLPVCDGGRL